ncbi:MAG: DUF4337 domain-containing protein [Hyphomicrobiaceae bacterium]
MALGEIEAEAETLGSGFAKWVSVYIAVLAVLLALCSMMGSNVDKDAARANVDATNLWAFFQAKNIRRAGLRIAVADLEIRLGTDTSLTPEGRRMIEAKIAEYKASDAKLTSDPERQEGLDELFVRAKAVEAARDDAARRGPYFDWAQALLQIAIVIASVAIISTNRAMFALSILIGAVGALLGLDGYLLLVDLPFLG